MHRQREMEYTTNYNNSKKNIKCNKVIKFFVLMPRDKYSSFPNLIFSMFSPSNLCLCHSFTRDSSSSSLHMLSWWLDLSVATHSTTFYLLNYPIFSLNRWLTLGWYLDAFNKLYYGSPTCIPRIFILLCTIFQFNKWFIKYRW